MNKLSVKGRGKSFETVPKMPTLGFAQVV